MDQNRKHNYVLEVPKSTGNQSSKNDSRWYAEVELCIVQNIIKLDSRVPCVVSDKGKKAWCTVVYILIAVTLPAQGHKLLKV